MILTIANQKGGVGKTTTTMNLGVALREAGKRVCLIDSDPQGNLSSYLGIRGEQIPKLDELYLYKKPLFKEIVQQWITPTNSGVDLIASDRALSGVEYYLFSRPDKEMILKNSLRAIQENYDYIIIDTPPSLNLLSINALVASDRVLVPVQPEFFSLEGIVKIRQAIEDIQSRWNPALSMIGVVVNQADQRRKLTQEVTGILQNELQGLLFNSIIHDGASITESSGQGKSVLEYLPSSKGAQEFRALTQEFLGRA